jgi:hypothetical protein
MRTKKTEYLIAVDEFCARHNIEISFISSLLQNGLIEPAAINETGFIDSSQVEKLEKFICFYYELDINLEGIETITRLLQRINSMQGEIISLKNRLRLYEHND